jgi:hypothetical protein
MGGSPDISGQREQIRVWSTLVRLNSETPSEGIRKRRKHILIRAQRKTLNIG